MHLISWAYDIYDATILPTSALFRRLWFLDLTLKYWKMYWHLLLAYLKYCKWYIQGDSVSIQPNLELKLTWPTRIFIKFGTLAIPDVGSKNPKKKIFWSSAFRVTGRRSLTRTARPRTFDRLYLSFYAS